MFPNTGITDEGTINQSPFDPYLHRTVLAPLTNFEAMLSFVKICSSLGMVMSIDAVSQVGYVMGLVCIPIVGLFLTYLLHVQFRSRYFLCRKLKVPYLSYNEGLKHCLEDGPKLLIAIKNLSSATVDFISVVNQFGSSSCCLMFVASGLEKTFGVSARILVLFFIPFLMIFVFINDLKRLVPINFVAILLQLCAISIMLYYIFKDFPPLTSRIMVQRPTCWPFFFARLLGSSEAVAVFVNIEKDMKKPEGFLKPFGVLNFSMVVIITINYILGVAGYIKYAPNCCLHYLNCHPLTNLIPTKEIPAYIAKIFYMIGVLLSYGINCYPAHSILWTKYFAQRFGNCKIYKYIFRATIISGTVVLALIEPTASILLSRFVNTLCLSFLGIIFPTILHICLLWPNNFGWLHIIYWWDLVLILVGVYFIIVSVYVIPWITLQIYYGKFDLKEELSSSHST